MAAILNVRLKSVSEKVGLCTSEKYVPENVGVVAGILSMSSVELEKSVGGVILPSPGGYEHVYTWVYEG